MRNMRSKGTIANFKITDDSTEAQNMGGDAPPPGGAGPRPPDSQKLAPRGFPWIFGKLRP